MSEPASKVSLEAFAEVLRSRISGPRRIVVLAGPPASGKSTLSERLALLLNEAGRGTVAAVLPMDGYHFDDLVLDNLGLRSRKGAPETFDVGGLHSVLHRLRRNDEDFVAVPVFDRDIEIARAGARLIPQSVRCIIVEGNYLLLDRPPWSKLRRLFDVTSMLRPPIDLLRERLIDRWRSYNLAPAQITEKVEHNDLPNVQLVLSASRSAEFLIEG